MNMEHIQDDLTEVLVIWWNLKNRFNKTLDQLYCVWHYDSILCLKKDVKSKITWAELGERLLASSSFKKTGSGGIWLIIPGIFFILKWHNNSSIIWMAAGQPKVSMEVANKKGTRITYLKSQLNCSSSGKRDQHCPATAHLHSAIRYQKICKIENCKWGTSVSRPPKDAT